MNRALDRYPQSSKWRRLGSHRDRFVLNNWSKVTLVPPGWEAEVEAITGPPLQDPRFQTKRCGEYVALDRGEEGVWNIPPFADEPDDKADKPTAKAGSTGTGEGAPTTKAVQAMSIEGNVALENWTEVFRCFVGPASRLGLKSLTLGIAFKLVAQDGQPLDSERATLRAMREAAKQLGLQIEEDGG